MVKDVNKLFYVIRPKGGGLFSFTVDVSVTKQARNSMGLAVHNQNQVVTEIFQCNPKSFSSGCRCRHL